MGDTHGSVYTKDFSRERCLAALSALAAQEAWADVGQLPQTLTTSSTASVHFASRAKVSEFMCTTENFPNQDGCKWVSKPRKCELSLFRDILGEKPVRTSRLQRF